MNVSVSVCVCVCALAVVLIVLAYDFTKLESFVGTGCVANWVLSFGKQFIHYMHIITWLLVWCRKEATNCLENA